MPLSISDLSKRKRSTVIEIETGEDEKHNLNVTYTPSGYTAALEAEIRNAREDSLRQADLAAKMLSNMIVSWDLTATEQEEDEKGNVVTKTVPYPCTYDALFPLPTEFLNTVLNGIVTDMRPGEA